MGRPTRACVEEAIEQAERVGPATAAWQMAHVLAAEVRALREELAELRRPKVTRIEPSEPLPLPGWPIEKVSREELAARYPELQEPSGPDWPFGPGVKFDSDAGDFVGAINALVAEARDAALFLEESGYPFAAGRLREALKPFEGE